MSNSDINKFKDKESDLYEEYKQPNAANQDISYKKNKQHPIIFENKNFIDLEPNFFSNLYLEGVHFKQCVFGKLESENTIFHKCSFEDCNFTSNEVLIQDSTFREECLFTNVHNITFRNVLFETTIFGAYITSCSFHDCNFLSCNYETLNVIEDSNFHGTAIQDSSKHSFKDIAFILTYLDFCNFENLIFIDTRFLDSSITHSDFNYVVFQRTEEEDEDDEKSIIKITDTDENRLLNYSNNRFNRCDLRHIDVNHANFEKSVFQHTKMPLVLNYCNFQTCIFALSMFSDDRPVPRGLNFDYEQTSFYHAVSFMGSVFQGVSFTRNDMSRVNFRNIRYEGTIFFHDGLIVKGLFGVPDDLVTRNIKFENYTLIDCKFANEIRNLSFINSDIRHNVFYNNTEFNQENYRSINNIHLDRRTQRPYENYVINDVNVPELDYVDDEEEYGLQIEAQKQRVINVIERAIDVEYEIPESNSVPNNNFFPQENDETVKIFDIIEGEINLDAGFINNFETKYPNHKIIIKKQKNNWYPYLIDMEKITTFLEEVTSEKINEEINEETNEERIESYYLSLSNIIFICDDEQNEEPSEEELGKYLSQTAYMNMKYFGIQGLLIPLTDIFALINPQNREKQIFIVENIQFEEEKKGLLSLAYAVRYLGADCTDKQVITAGELQYFHKWKEMLRTLTTPISSRAPSATSQISTNTSFIPITNGDNITPDIINYEGDEEDNDDEEDDEDENENDNGDESDGTEEEIVNILNNKRPAEQDYEPSKKRKTGGRTKKRINKQKNKKTKKQKTKK
tara:strand:- start:2454 stop:4841 length:2388 start_codon:yes stop_codon:yes gene_type:complete